MINAVKTATRVASTSIMTANTAVRRTVDSSSSRRLLSSTAVAGGETVGSAGERMSGAGGEELLRGLNDEEVRIPARRYVSL